MTDPVMRLSEALAGRYRFEREIGAGGMATVYLAHDERYDRSVAVKVLKPAIAAAVGTERFLREIRITAQLNHPHILPLLDSGRVNRGIDGSTDRGFAGSSDRPSDAMGAVRSDDPTIHRSPDYLYYVMPYVAGGSLRQRMRGGAPLALAAVLRIAEQVAAALDHTTEDGTLTIGAVERIAAEVGIPPARVRAAAAEMSVPGTVVAAEERGTAPSRVTAVPLPVKSGKIIVEREIGGEIPRELHEDLVAEIHRALGFVGTVSSVGGSLQWNGKLPGFVGRDVRVLVTREHGRTRVRVEEHVELRGASIFAPGWGAAGGALVTFGVLSALGLPETTFVLAIPMAIGGAIATAWGTIAQLSRRRRPELERLADRLAETAARAALPPGSSDR
jgi:hypothetical protein